MLVIMILLNPSTFVIPTGRCRIVKSYYTVNLLNESLLTLSPFPSYVVELTARVEGKDFDTETARDKLNKWTAEKEAAAAEPEAKKQKTDE